MLRITCKTCWAHTLQQQSGCAWAIERKRVDVACFFTLIMPLNRARERELFTFMSKYAAVAIKRTYTNRSCNEAKMKSLGVLLSSFILHISRVHKFICSAPVSRGVESERERKIWKVSSKIMNCESSYPSNMTIKWNNEFRRSHQIEENYAVALEFSISASFQGIRSTHGMCSTWILIIASERAH